MDLEVLKILHINSIPENLLLFVCKERDRLSQFIWHFPRSVTDNVADRGRCSKFLEELCQLVDVCFFILFHRLLIRVVLLSQGIGKCLLQDW